ncbi:conjugal transfer protein TraF [Zhongshania arctica]|uniref:Conjugal transfer protein TraF n=1 Tax=Zhongshania arctica TaxID=3238302 RepID=A0ABV3TQZ1_9GAMM
MYKIPLFLMLLSLAASNLTAETRHDIVRAIANPAHTEFFSEADPFLISIGGKVYLDDSDDLLGEVQKTVNMTVEALSSQGLFLLIPGQQQPLIDQLKKVDGKSVLTIANVNTAISIPSDKHALQLNINASGRGAGTFVFDPEDEQTLQLAAAGLLLGASDLKSRVVASLLIVSDVGLSYSRPFFSSTSIKWGTAIKLQSITLIERTRRITEYEESELLSWQRDVKTQYHANADLGLTWQRDALELSAAVINVNPGEFRGPLNGRYNMRPAVKIGGVYNPGRIGFDFNWDVTPDEGFGVSEDLQTASLATRYLLQDNLVFGLGYHHVQKGNFVDSVEAKLRYQFSSIYFEASGRFATGSIGGGLQAQMMF